MQARRPGGSSADPLRNSVTPSAVFRYKRHHPLNAIFEPKSIAVVGATEKGVSAGRTLLWNLISNPFGGTVFPVNPRRASVLGIKAYPTLAALPEPVDLAVIVTPAPILRHNSVNTQGQLIRRCYTWTVSRREQEHGSFLCTVTRVARLFVRLRRWRVAQARSQEKRTGCSDHVTR